jgi:hypothetical protein
MTKDEIIRKSDEIFNEYRYVGTEHSVIIYLLKLIIRILADKLGD